MIAIKRNNNTTSSTGNKLLKKAKIESLPKNIRDSIPFRGAMPNGIIETKAGTFTKTYPLKDINFQLAPLNEQMTTFNRFSEILKSFDEHTRWQFTIFNHKVPKKETLENIRIKPMRDGLNKYREEMNRFRVKRLQEGSNSIKRDKFLTVAIDDVNAEHAASVLRRIDSEVSNQLQKIVGVDTRPMSTMKRLETLYNIYNQDTDYRFDVTDFDEKDSLSLKDIEKQGISIKDVIGPSIMNFTPMNYFCLGDTYARVFYLDKVGNVVKSSYLSDLSDISGNLIISLNAEKLPQDEAQKLAKGRVLEIESQIAEIKRKSRRDNDDPYISASLERKKENAYEVEKDVNARNQNIIFMSMFVCIFADSKEQLDDLTSQVRSVARKHSCPLRTIGLGQQEPAFNSCLPLCRNDMFFDLFFTTETASVFIPFSSEVINQKNSIYYGTNALSKSMILYDRLTGSNYNGLVFGGSGSGKSFFVKYEIACVHLSMPKAQIFVVDPSNEYQKLCTAFNGSVIKLAPGSNIYINPLDLDLGAKDEEMDPVTMKADFVLSMLEIMNSERKLDPACRSIVDRCIRKIYKPYIAAINERTDGVTCDPSIAPTLCDLYQELRNMDNVYADQLADILEIYAVGSLNTFAHRTNVKTEAKMVVYDIQSLGSGMRELGLYICLSDIWNRTIANRKKGIYTWSYYDEFHLLLRSSLTTEFVLKIWKMIRKWYGVPTGILQNTSDLLRDESTQNIINNTEFVVMKQSKPLDIQNLQVLFELSDSQLTYISNGNKKSGLIYMGKTTVPFTLDFPKNTKLFELMDTTEDKKNNISLQK